MKAEELIRALNDVDEKYIKEAAEYKKTGGSVKLWRTIAIAACVCLAASAVLTLNAIDKNGQQSRKSVSSDAYSDAYTDTYEDTYYAEEVETMPAYYEAGSTAAAGSAEAPDMRYEAAAEEAYFEEYDAVSEQKALPAGNMAIAAGGAGIDAVGTMEEEEADVVPKIIYNVYMQMQTREYDKTVSEIEQAVSACNGYLENQNLSNNANAYRSADYTIRIPAGNLEDFLQQAGEIATVTYMNKSAQDVSEAYYDTKSRLDTAKAKLERLQELLAEAEDMADIIEIESAIADAQWEIDSYAGTLRYYDSEVDYSTVSIGLQEVYEIVTEEAPMTFGEKIAQAFTSGLKSVGTFFRDLAIWISGAWVWIVIIAAIIVAAILIIRRIVLRRKMK